jgi:hypothetical protein
MKTIRNLLCILLILLLTLAVGCASSTPKTYEGTSKLPESPQPTTPAEASGVGKYYDFPDIQIPSGMELKKDRSIIFTVRGVKAGLLVFRDYVDAESLFNFFLEGMSKDAWTLKSSNKYPTSALFYAKQGKTCIIHIFETTFHTELSIWVAPTN